MLFNTIIDLLSSDADDKKNTSKTNREQLIQLSTAALLVEISLADSVIQQEESDFILSAVQTEFGLSPEEAAELIQEASVRVKDSVSLFEFTNHLKDKLNRKERNHVVELLWKVVNADSVIDKYEEYYVRKIADLLYVSQDDYIKTKLTVLGKI